MSKLNTIDQKSAKNVDRDICDKCLQKFNIHSKLQNDLNVVRNCLQHLMRMERKAIDSLTEGKY